MNPWRRPRLRLHQVEQTSHFVGDGQHEQQRVEAVEQAAMAGQERTHVLHAEIAFQ